ncbi:GLPGLI family protein [Flavobacterium cyclinae]|uniref:GLPGLI family protein n=1 Tax=Flavobacterium cyclinae TaxID=2895947 RepID=UPI001E545C28|nr:GLPGLI family protein [Flavobacterium cyclinae]UGS21065.1 GLPGLI family protein [Flavobacterium cyclinae]
MKHRIIALLFFYINTFSQESGIITYKSFFSVKQATEELKQQNRMWYQEELDHEMMAKQLRFTLQFNTEASIFTMSENMISDIENQLSKKYTIGRFYGSDTFFINRKKDTLIEQLTYSFATLLRKKKASFINWNLTTETKEIQGYKCYKATYTYVQKWKGREFLWPVVAWYCPEIPISLGPTRYSGLPGLILELHENEIGYIVDKIDFVSLPKKIVEPKIGEILDDEEINLRDQNVKNEMLNSK